MRIAVFSDLHGGDAGAIERAFDAYDYVFFLGDGISDTDWLRYSYPTRYFDVCGNCDDCFSDAPDERSFALGGVNILATHGHRYHVKSGLPLLKAEARRQGAQIVLYGHTHVASVLDEGGVLYVNPGSCSGAGGRATYACVHVENGSYFAEIIKI